MKVVVNFGWVLVGVALWLEVFAVFAGLVHGAYGLFANAGCLGSPFCPVVAIGPSTVVATLVVAMLAGIVNIIRHGHLSRTGWVLLSASTFASVWAGVLLILTGGAPFGYVEVLASDSVVIYETDAGSYALAAVVATIAVLALVVGIRARRSADHRMRSERSATS